MEVVLGWAAVSDDEGGMGGAMDLEQHTRSRRCLLLRFHV